MVQRKKSGKARSSDSPECFIQCCCVEFAGSRGHQLRQQVQPGNRAHARDKWERTSSERGDCERREVLSLNAIFVKSVALLRHFSVLRRFHLKMDADADKSFTTQDIMDSRIQLI